MDRYHPQRSTHTGNNKDTTTSIIAFTATTAKKKYRDGSLPSNVYRNSTHVPLPRKSTAVLYYLKQMMGTLLINLSRAKDPRESTGSKLGTVVQTSVQLLLLLRFGLTARCV